MPMLLLIVIAPLSSQPNGKNDGSVQGKAYFKCKPKFGVFVRPSQVKLLNSEGNPVEDISSRSGGRLVSGEYIVVCRSPRVRARLTFPWTSLVRDLLCPRMQETSAGRTELQEELHRYRWPRKYTHSHSGLPIKRLNPHLPRIASPIALHDPRQPQTNHHRLLRRYLAATWHR